MDFLKIFEFSGSIITIIGVGLIAIPKVLGLVLLLIASIIWMFYFYITHQFFLMIQNTILLFFNIVAIYNWRKKGIK